MKSSGGWSYFGVIIFTPIFGILPLSDVLIKITFKDKTKIIWIVELIALGLIYFLRFYKFVG